ncbi:hypothetical protein F4604DRAFT_1934223 [Suillus subluteus]|nr:hypothetical protein F4604DRAFT_1934223 [Suillus subluteus]
MPKRKLFNVANLGSWAKSLGHSGNKENEVPMTTNMSESPPSSPKAGLFKGMAVILHE